MNKAAIIIIFGIIVLAGFGFFFRDSFIPSTPEGFDEEAAGLDMETIEGVIEQLPSLGEDDADQPGSEDKVELEPGDVDTSDEEPLTLGDAATHVVSYTESGFDPTSLEIHLGDTVRWVNQGDKLMWVASDIHPTHKLFPEFDHKRAVGSGSFYEFTFEKLGDWTYHNHVSANHLGTITVE